MVRENALFYVVFASSSNEHFSSHVPCVTSDLTVRLRTALPQDHWAFEKSIPPSFGAASWTRVGLVKRHLSILFPSGPMAVVDPQRTHP